MRTAKASFFPALAYAADLDELKNNRAYRMLTLDTMDNPDIPAIWRDFVAYHCSAEFYARFCDLWVADIERTHANLQENFGVPLRDFSVGIRQASKEENPENLIRTGLVSFRGLQ